MAKYPKRQKVKRYRRSFLQPRDAGEKGHWHRGAGPRGAGRCMGGRAACAGLGDPYVVHRRAQPGSFRLLPGGRERFVRSREHGVVRGGGTGSFFGGPAGGGDPAVDGTAIVEGAWAEADLTTLTDDAAIRAAAQQLAAQGAKYAVVTLKDAAGAVYYASQVPAAAASPAGVTVDPAKVASIFKDEGPDPGGEACRLPGPRRCPRGSRHGHPV